MSEGINFYIREEPYGFLSNFWRANQTIDGILYPTNEHYYQSQKALTPNMSEWIASAPTAFAAMSAGRALREKEIVPNWQYKKIEVMLTGLRAKFSQNLILQQALLFTYDAILYEDSPTDTFWGKKGENMLGNLLMQVRAEIRQNTEKVIKDELKVPIYGDCGGW